MTNSSITPGQTQVYVLFSLDTLVVVARRTALKAVHTNLIKPIGFGTVLINPTGAEAGISRHEGEGPSRWTSRPGFEVQDLWLLLLTKKVISHIAD